MKAAFETCRGRTLEGVLLTTNYVVDETITLLRRRGHPDPAVGTGCRSTS